VAVIAPKTANKYSYHAVADINSIIFSFSFQILEDLINQDKNLYKIIEDFVVSDHLTNNKLDIL